MLNLLDRHEKGYKRMRDILPNFSLSDDIQQIDCSPDENNEFEELTSQDTPEYKPGDTSRIRVESKIPHTGSDSFTSSQKYPALPKIRRQYKPVIILLLLLIIEFLVFEIMKWK